MTTSVKTTWKIDPSHSEIQFKVKHLMISTVTGTFNVFKGELVADSDDFENGKISFEVDAASIDTNLDERDTHLKSPLFLHVDLFPKITFLGNLQKTGNDLALIGELSLHGIKRHVTIETELTGMGKGRFGDTRAGFELSGKINRKDFGLDFNLLTDTGSLVVGEEIKLHADIQLIKLQTGE